jgi:predicted ATP-grasp superfamily ATP-dependent carboligase
MKDFKLPENPKIPTGFKIPDSYFDDLQSKLDAKLYKKESKVIAFYNQNKSWIYTAAAILVVAFSIPLATFNSTETTKATTIDIENYITNRHIITEEELANELSQANIDALKQELLPTITEDDILLENENSYDNLNL